MVIIYFFTSSVLIFSQQEIEVPKDTVLRYQGINSQFNLSYGFDDQILFGNNNFLTDNIPLYNDSSTIWLRTEVALSPSFLQNDKTWTHQHLTSILHQQYLKDSKFDPVRYVLGMAQLGAVGYLVYRHIKKYGFR